LSQEDITQALSQPAITQSDRRGLEFMREHFNQIVPQGESIRHADLDKYMKQLSVETEQRRVAAGG
jgi:hypothetical protein